MAYVIGEEANKVELYGSQSDGRIRRYTVADGATISKGILCKLTDARTAAETVDADKAGLNFAGIAATTKEANDGSTTLGLWTHGVFDLVASGAILEGDLVIMAGDGGNRIQSALNCNGLVAASGAVIVGKALEAASDGERINVYIDV